MFVLQHQLKLLEAQKRQQELILRRKTEEVSCGSRKTCFHREYRYIMYRRNTCDTLCMQKCMLNAFSVHFSVCHVCQVTALRRQARPTSGKVVRKINLPEPVQDSQHRPPSGRMYSSGNTAPNGTRWVCVWIGVFMHINVAREASQESC